MVLLTLKAAYDEALDTLINRQLVESFIMKGTIALSFACVYLRLRLRLRKSSRSGTVLFVRRVKKLKKLEGKNSGTRGSILQRGWGYPATPRICWERNLCVMLASACCPPRFPIMEEALFR
jgi:hypothetical protein